jgi:hypothetical protein
MSYDPCGNPATGTGRPPAGRRNLRRGMNLAILWGKARERETRAGVECRSERLRNDPTGHPA